MSFMASPRVIGLALLSLLVAPRTTARVIPSMSSDTATPSAPSSAFLSPLRVQIVSARRKERNPNPRSESASSKPQHHITANDKRMSRRKIHVLQPTMTVMAQSGLEQPEQVEQDASNAKVVSELRLGFVGAGMMATAMINGIIAAKISKPEGIIASAGHKASLDRLAASGIRTAESNSQVASESNVVVLAVKPNVIPSVLREIETSLAEDSLVVSIAAGIPIAALEKLVPGKRLVRVMPNTPCLVSEGATGYSMGSLATERDKEVVQGILGSVGYACEVKEPLLDAVTGVSGSGPAYIFVLIEALADGGVRMGLPRAMALKLAAQTVKGAAAMVLETGEHPAVLKDQVCSPGGLTIAAIESLEKNGFRAAAMTAVITVASKSIQMREDAESKA